jgi:cell division protein FtsL
MAMLKELIACHLVDPTHINIMKRSPDHYQVQIKGDYNIEDIEEHAKKHGLTIEDDKEKNCIVIYKP